MTTDIAVTVVAEPAEVTVLAQTSTVVLVDPAQGALADINAERIRALAVEADLQDQIDAVEASDVDSVAGLSGTVTASALKTALSLPTDTGATLTGLRSDLDQEEADRATADTALDGRLDSLESQAATFGDIITHNASEFTTDAELASEASVRANADTALAGSITSAVAAQHTADQSEFANASTTTTALAGKVPTTRTVNGHALSADVTVSKSDVGLGSVDNTADTAKPVSTPQATAIAVVQSDVTDHKANTSNPHSVTKAQVGLANADNTSDLNKPVSLALAQLVQWARNPDQLIAGSVTRDSNDAATTAPVVWPDGTVGTYTADTLSTAFPGAVDGYHITYGSPATRTFTQPTVTRSATGAVTALPAIVVT